MAELLNDQPFDLLRDASPIFFGSILNNFPEFHWHSDLEPYAHVASHEKCWSLREHNLAQLRCPHNSGRFSHGDWI